MMPDVARKVWVEGIQPQLSDGNLLALARGLAGNDERIIPRAICEPPALSLMQDWPVERADPIAFAYWQGDRAGSATVGEIEDDWVECILTADETLGLVLSTTHFLTWLEEVPRDQWRRFLLALVNAELRRRGVLPLPIPGVA